MNTIQHRWILLFGISLFFIDLSRQNCSYTLDNDGTPRVLKGAEAIPISRTYSQPFICEKVLSGPNCCNEYQLDATFGSIGNGCDNCASNLKRFWCLYTCSPNQTDFMVIAPNPVIVPNPIDEGATTLSVQDVTILVDSQTVCDIWTSCNMTPYANQVSAMKTPAGFLAFQGANAVAQGGQTIGMKYSSDITKKPLIVTNVTTCNAPQPPLDPDPLKPQPWYPDQYGFNIAQPCSCNNCAESCTKSVFTPLPVMEGFNWIVVSLFYIIIVIISFGCTWLRKNRKQHKQSHDGDDDCEQLVDAFSSIPNNLSNIPKEINIVD